MVSQCCAICWQGATKRRWATLLLYLHPAAAGGHTAFSPEAAEDSAAEELQRVCAAAAADPERQAVGGGHAFRLSPGSALLWLNYREGMVDERTRHSGCEVLEGEKWVLNLWVRPAAAAA